jgi:hypothetical protein
MKGWKYSTLREENKYSENSTELAAHTQIPKQQNN